MNESQIFGNALQRATPAERAAYLDEVCAGDAALRAAVEALLRAHTADPEFLERPAPPPEGTVDEVSPSAAPVSEAMERSGLVLAGRYKLIEAIGEGGMGSVWMAQQTEPVKRLVAVKLIKAGMDSKQVIARFEAERQALALMDHPNMARVLDAGTNSAGRPYFVMDLVKGVPITKYCDEHHLTPRQRLELFVPVCQAVQHAHQKGIIHRDLKPSNVLVAPYDGKPIVKVIDFGVAKATGQQLTDRTLVTGFGNIVGTLEYMSPEQAELNNHDIDTRSDIYSLGVLLYELLTGGPPFSCKEAEKAGMLEMLRVIREQEPTRPSTKLSTAEGLPTLAANRGTEPAKLTRLVRGELDWIVMKALEKDRNRRYETANGFAMDVQRYLNDEPVLACPPSAGYRLRKFVRRYKGPVIAASVILFCLLAGILGTSGGLVWAVRERGKKADALLAEIDARAAEKQARDRAMTALRAMTDNIVEKQMARGTRLTEENKQFLRTIIEHFEGFAAITADDAESRAIRAEGHQRVGLMRDRLGESKEAEAAYVAAVAAWKQLAAEYPTRSEFRQNLARSSNNLGNLFQSASRLEEAETAYADALAAWKLVADENPTRPEFRQVLSGTQSNLGNLRRAMGRMKEAETAYRDALAVRKQLVADSPKRAEFRDALARTYNNLGYLLQSTNRRAEAEAAYAEALVLQEQLVAEYPARPEFRQELGSSQHNLAILLRTTGRLKEAEATLAKALALRKQLAAEFPARPEFRRELANSLDNRSILLRATDRLKEAEAACREALALRKQLVADVPGRPEFRQDLAQSHNQLGQVLQTADRLKEAETAYGDALALRKRLAAEFPTRTAFRENLALALNNLGALLLIAGRLKEAEAHLAEALPLRKQLAADFPNQPDLRNELANTHVNLALVRLQQRDFKASKAYLDEALSHHAAALEANPRHPDFRDDYGNYLKALIQANAGLGDQAEAKQAAATLRDLGGDAPANAYNAACSLARCILIVRPDEQAETDERDKQEAVFYGDEAMTMLRDAVAKGYKDAARMDKQSDLAPLRGREDFQKLLADLKAK